MVSSILDTIKKLLGIASSDTSFDTDIIIHINSAIASLRQLGVGPAEGYSIKSKTDMWTSYLTTTPELFESVKTYIYLKVRLAFDPPSSAAVLEAFKQMISEYEWRLNVTAETNL